MRFLTFVSTLLLTFALIQPLQAQQYKIEYDLDGAVLELSLGEAQMSGDYYQAPISALYEGTEGAFEVHALVTAPDEDLLVAAGWPAAIAVLGNALEIPDDGILEFTVLESEVSVEVLEADTFWPQPDNWVPTVLGAVTPVAILDGIFFSPDELESVMTQVTGISLAEGTGNLDLFFEEVVVDGIRQWRVTVTDQQGYPVPGAHVTHIVPNPDGANDFVILNLTDESGLAIFGSSILEQGTQISFVATDPGNSERAGAIVLVPPSAQ